jgi:ferredoxin
VSQLRIVADQGRCTSAGNCARVAPELFDQDEQNGTVVLLQAEPPASLVEAAREAESLCPANAITVIED